MKRRVWLAAVVAVMSVGLVFCGVGQVMAKVTGPCADCHTMHYSQDGVDGKVVQPTGSITQTLSNGPFRALTVGGCVGCHTGVNTATSNIPYVFSTTLPTYASVDNSSGNTLAGGNFYWVADAAGNDDTKGHNVLTTNAATGTALNTADAMGVTPPGWNANMHPGSFTEWTGKQLTCAGTYGCHGQRNDDDDFVDISGAHHSNVDGYTSGGDWANSYRFLDGIAGYEDDDYEKPGSIGGSDTHNVYSGVDRSTIAATPAVTSTISAFCAQCHGNFHSGLVASTGGVAEGNDTSSSWLRHPTDYDMANTLDTSEYASYNTDGSYSMQAPLGTSDYDQDSSTTTYSVTTANDTAIVTCISCHRAHGSPYADLLRWDYSTMSAANGTSGNVGCFTCHTTKDD